MSSSDSGARTGPQEIGLIAGIVVRKDEDAARRIYRKYHMERFRFGVHVRRDHGLAEEMLRETFMKFCPAGEELRPGPRPGAGVAVHDGPLGCL